MIRSDDLPDIMRLDDFETKAWAYFAKGRVRGSAHTEARALKLLLAAHERGVECIVGPATRPAPHWWKTAGGR